MSKNICYFTVFAQCLVLVKNLALFTVSGSILQLSHAQWVCWILLFVGLQVIQWYNAVLAMVTCWLLKKADDFQRRDVHTQLLVTLLCSTMFLTHFCALVRLLW